MQNNFASVQPACLWNGNGILESYLEKYIILKIRTTTSTVVFSLTTVGPRVAGITCWYTRAIVTLEFIITTPSYKKTINVWLMHNMIYLFNIFSNITGFTNSYHPSCYRHISDRNIYTTSLPIISLVLSSRITSYLIRAIIFPYYVSCRILTFPIDVIILYHMPYQILITCTRRSLSSNTGIT